MECRMCYRQFTPAPKKPRPEPKDDFELPPIALLVFAVGESLASDVCQDKACQRQLQYECDEFDRARKGE